MKDPRYVGIERHGKGWRAVVSRGQAPRLFKYFPKDTPPAEMQQWRADTKAAARVERKRRASRGTFEGDAKRYLAAVSGLPTIDQRTHEIGLWVQVFGTKARDSITATEIRTQRDRWMMQTKPKALAPATINKRLRALSNLFRVLDGSTVHNPVRDVPELPTPHHAPRRLSHEHIRKILDAVPNLGLAARGKKRPKVSPTRIRLRCLAFCQVTPKQLQQLKAADLDLIDGKIRLPARAKGQGAQAIWVDLVPEARDAFKDFHQQQLYGYFSRSSLWKSFKRAAIKAGFPRARPYDMRHAYGALIYRATHSREAVSRLLQHASWSTSAIYAAEAEDDVRDANSKAVVEHFGAVTPRRH